MLKLLASFLRIDDREVELARRGFLCSRPEVRRHLEEIGKSFLLGYHAALQYHDQQQLARDLTRVDCEYRGFAYEGAAMAMVILDSVSPGNARFRRFASGAGKNHIYMLHVGAGWACARLPWRRFRLESSLRKFDPLLRWLAVDGFGFHEGYFYGPQRARRRIARTRVTAHARHVFYQGLGRSLWFSCAASIPAIAGNISSMAPDFQGDAWSGVGLACTYAGGIPQNEIEELRSASGPHKAWVAQGAAFAARARQLAGNVTPHTEAASAILCDLSVDHAAALCEEALGLLDPQHSSPYQQWRQILQKTFSKQQQINVRGTSDESTPIMVSPASRQDHSAACRCVSVLPGPHSRHFSR